MVGLEGLQVHHTQQMCKAEATREGSVSKLTKLTFPFETFS